MDLIIDPEFRDLIPPLTEEEYNSLEENLLTNGFNPAFPVIVWKGQNIIVDGHNRYGICQKHGIAFDYIEQEFASRYDVKQEMYKIQFDRRNMNSRTKTYLVGKRYLMEKMEEGNPNGFGAINQRAQNAPVGRTREKIAAQLGINHSTVLRAAEFALAVDKIVSVTGIKVNDILVGKIKDPMDDIKDLARNLDDVIKDAIYRVLSGENLTLKMALAAITREELERKTREAEKKRKQMEEEFKKSREEEDQKERERLRQERENKLAQERERIEKEKEEQEQRRRAEIEKEIEKRRKEAEERAKHAEEREKLRKDAEEHERIEKAKLEAEIKRLQEIKQKKLESAMLEQKRMDEEILRKARIEREKQDREIIEKTVKVSVPVTDYDQYIKAAYTIMGEITLNACRPKKADNADNIYIINTQIVHNDPETLNQNWIGKVWLDLLDSEKDSKCYIEKLVSRFVEGGITEAFVIARNTTDSEWFKLCSQKASAVVFPTKTMTGKLKSHALIYFGDKAETFMKECEKFGWGTILKK